MNKPGEPMVPGWGRPARYEELPPCLIGVKVTHVGNSHPVLAAKLAARPQRLLPLPDLSGYSAHAQKAMKNLAQYRGRTPEGNLKSMKNIQWHERPIDMPDQIPQVVTPQNLPQPTVPIAVPQVPRGDLMRAKSLKVVMSQNEYNLYVETWNRWWEAHAEDYVVTKEDGTKLILPEDELDVHRVCMETVIQYRLELEQTRYPSKDLSRAYDSSFARQETARKNLSARRSDRISQKNQDKNKGGNTFNVAFIAGGVTQEMIDQKKQDALKEKDGIAAFLEGTVVKSAEAITAETADEVGPA